MLKTWPPPDTVALTNTTRSALSLGCGRWTQWTGYTSSKQVNEKCFSDYEGSPRRRYSPSARHSWYLETSEHGHVSYALLLQYFQLSFALYIAPIDGQADYNLHIPRRLTGRKSLTHPVLTGPVCHITSVCTVTTCFLQSSEDSSLQPQFSLTILLCLRSETRHYGHFNRCSYLLTNWA